MNRYHGRARNLARVLHPTTPIRVRPWGWFAWAVVAVIIAALLTRSLLS